MGNGGCSSGEEANVRVVSENSLESSETKIPARTSLPNQNEQQLFQSRVVEGPKTQPSCLGPSKKECERLLSGSRTKRNHGKKHQLKDREKKRKASPAESPKKPNTIRAN
ncbi:hypothetical protein OIU84_017572 [Salix udensis]|uniref:Uncharacterized protein n=1 Tax=Salix udensis TaxID=889485 RepID=A0AAD6L256_9ROSI|nr:hypothetical protein OIU84_017572 [Salix udensis]